jgi:hypothetical protein
MPRRAVILIFVLLLTACGEIGLPQVTPTLAPSRTPISSPEATLISQELPSRTPFATLADTSTTTPTITVLPTESATPQPTSTDVPSATPTDTPSATPSWTATQTDEPTATPTWTPSPTVTATPSLTPTNTLPPTSTPLPAIGQAVSPSPTPSPTFTPTLTFTPAPTITALPPTATAIPATNTALPTNTLLPTTTPLPTSTPDVVATAFAQLTLTVRPTLTPLPAVPTSTLPPPTIDATPTFITAEAETPVAQPDFPTVTPVLGEGDTQPGIPTATQTPAPTVANVVPPPTVAVSDLPRIEGPDLSSRAFVLGPGGGSVIAPGITNPTLFIRNPQNPSEYLATDQIGLIYTVRNGVTSGPGDVAPWGGQPRSREENNAVVVDAAWSPDGEAVAFVVDSDRTGADGVWIYQPGVSGPTQLLVDCPPGCFAEIPGIPYEYESLDVVWSPQNDAILVSLNMLDVQRRGFLVLRRDENYNFRPAAYSFDYADWAPDGRIVVSGRDRDGQVILGLLNRGERDAQVVLNGSQRGFWLQHGVQRPGGEFYALGRPGDPNGPMQIYDGGGTPRTDLIGSTRPIDVKWNQDRSQVYVQTEDGRKFVAEITGPIREITNEVGGIQAVAWITGRLPPLPGNPNVNLDTSPGGDVAPGYIPSGVIEGSRYQPGQQLRVLATAGLAVRENPSTDALQIGSALPGTFVAILAGPVRTDNIVWWRVQTVETTGWIAGEIDSITMLGP